MDSRAECTDIVSYNDCDLPCCDDLKSSHGLGIPEALRIGVLKMFHAFTDSTQQVLFHFITVNHVYCSEDDSRCDNTLCHRHRGIRPLSAESRSGGTKPLVRTRIQH